MQVLVEAGFRSFKITPYSENLWVGYSYWTLFWLLIFEVLEDAMNVIVMRFCLQAFLL